MARRFGATDVQLDALERGDLEIFAPAERVALLFSDQLTRDANAISDETFTELRRHFNEGEIVEITAVAGLFNYFNRFNNALEMEPTR